MIKKYALLFFPFMLGIVFFTSCKKDPKHVFDGNSETEQATIIRPILEEDLVEKNDSIKKYYQLFDNYEIWYHNENRNALISVIKNIDEDGLNPADYQYSKIAKLELRRPKMEDEEISTYDVLLTEMFDQLAKDLFYGKLNPKKLYTDWDLSKNNIVLSHYLVKAIEEKRIASAFDKLKPQHETYASLKRALKEIKKYKEDTVPQIAIDSKIEQNSSTDAVISIKKRLKYWGDYAKNDSVFSTIYDSYTFEAVKKFQNRHGLHPDGVIGNATVRALNKTRSDRENQLIVNLERWRWFPKNFGNDYIIINLPNYKLDYVTYNDTIIDKNIVIGTKKRKTPILTSKISNLVIYPTWTVPPTIIKEDLTPKATKNRDYFSRTRLTIYKNGDIVTPEDWDPEKSKSYRYVQEVGYNNSLGLIKFNFPNRHMVYLHDTNHRDYFTRENRALSSGCVRVEKPLELANIILQKESKNWETSKMDTLIKNKNTKTIHLKTSIDVYMLYWTAWQSKKGLEFREDIYDLDNELYKKLRS